MTQHKKKGKKKERKNWRRIDEGRAKELSINKMTQKKVNALFWKTRKKRSIRRKKCNGKSQKEQTSGDPKIYVG